MESDSKIQFAEVILLLQTFYHILNKKHFKNQLDLIQIFTVKKKKKKQKKKTFMQFELPQKTIQC